ncbi:monooxygenase 2-like [Typha latifolia]|uniref:monooxygenase 2-like n=1 Tax=Typha latifolia TaxID=4733 RepID=UPI003C306AEC
MEEEEEEEEEVVIVGAGITGLAIALALERVGVRSLVLERSHELRASGTAISIFPSGWRALQVLGVDHKLSSIYPSYNTVHSTNLETGETRELSLIGTMDRVGIGVRTVHRKVLLHALAEDLPHGTIRFSSKLVSINMEAQEDSSSNVIALHLDGGTIIKAKVLIGCDGVHSVVAQWLGLSAPVDSDRSAIRGLAEFPGGHGFQFEGKQYRSRDKRAGFVPLNDKEIYWFITHDTSSRERESTRHPRLILRHVTHFLAADFPPTFLHVVGSSDPRTVTWTHMLLRVPWDLLFGWTHRGCATVAGDAMHPMTQDLPLGGCAALEDAVVLARHLGPALNVSPRRPPAEVEKAIAAYVKERRWRVAGLVAGSYISGWAQRGGGGVMSGMWRWVVRFVCVRVFARYVSPRIVDAINYDCGNLNTVD